MYACMCVCAYPGHHMPLQQKIHSNSPPSSREVVHILSDVTYNTDPPRDHQCDMSSISIGSIGWRDGE